MTTSGNSSKGICVIELDNPSDVVACPDRNSSVRFSHPRIYMKLSQDGCCQCPYCGTIYVRAADKQAHIPVDLHP